MVQSASRGSAHRETLQQKYDEKLSHIKDVCAQFFFKVEQQLGHTQDQTRHMQKQQDDWIDKILRPQDTSQARLFAIETRLKEAELARASAEQFHKDTFRKLIFAIEQHAGVPVADPQTVEATLKQRQSRQTNMRVVMSQGSARGEPNFQFSNALIPFAPTLPALVEKEPTTSDILFLKRLLFLKSCLDN